MVENQRMKCPVERLIESGCKSFPLSKIYISFYDSVRTVTRWHVQFLPAKERFSPGQKLFDLQRFIFQKFTGEIILVWLSTEPGQIYILLR